MLSQVETLTLNIDEVVEHLCQIKRNSKLVLAIDVGRLVVEKIYRGDPDLVRSRGRNHTGFRRLAAHPRVPFSRSTLWRYVGVYQIALEQPWLVRCQDLTVAHISAVLGLPAPEQERLLRLAAEQGWKAKRLARETQGEGPKRQGSVGSLVRRLERIKKLNLEQAEVAEPDRQKLLAAVAEAKAWCDTVEAWLLGGVAN
jgi:hypothetical protein